MSSRCRLTAPAPKQSVCSSPPPHLWWSCFTQQVERVLTRQSAAILLLLFTFILMLIKNCPTCLWALITVYMFLCDCLLCDDGSPEQHSQCVCGSVQCRTWPIQRRTWDEYLSSLLFITSDWSVFGSKWSFYAFNEEAVNQSRADSSEELHCRTWRWLNVFSHPELGHSKPVTAVKSGGSGGVHIEFFWKGSLSLSWPRW